MRAREPVKEVRTTPFEPVVQVVVANQRRLVNCLEAGKLLGTKAYTVRRLVKGGKLPAVWIGRLLKTSSSTPTGLKSASTSASGRPSRRGSRRDTRGPSTSRR